MSRRFDLPIALLAWCAGFAWVARFGSWLPLAGAALIAAVRLLSSDPATRRLLRPTARLTAIGLGGGVANSPMRES